MHSRRKGKSGSVRPIRKAKPAWEVHSDRETELLVAKLSKEGMAAAQIGMALRDSYGIPSVKLLTGKSISRVLAEHKLAPDIPDDLLALLKRSITISKHMEKNHKDQPGKRGLDLTQSKIRRLIKYYKNAGKLPQDWTYDQEKIRLLIE